MKHRIRIGSLEIDPLSFDEALDAVEALVMRRGGGTVFTPNVDHVVMAEDDARVREAYARTDLSLVDGTPVLWASRALGTPLPEKVSGSDLLKPLVMRARARGYTIFLFGGGPGVAERVKRALEEEFPGVRIVGTAAPRVDVSQNTTDPSVIDAIRTIRRRKPDLLFLALGSPKQEIFAQRIREAVRPTVVVGVGAAFDFVAGTAKRAPRWMSAAGLEWLYRLGHEPGRLWRRYLLRDPAFFGIVLRQALGRRALPSSSPAE